MKTLVFIGAPGSGKGTQAELLKKEFGYVHISTGDLFRMEISNNTALGKQIEQVLARGELVNDDVVMDVIAKKCSSNLGNNFLFDGFPRTVNQAEMIVKRVVLPEYLRVVHFDIAQSVLVDRLVNRRVCKSCGKILNLKSLGLSNSACDSCRGELVHRSDDKEDVILNRLKVFNEQAEKMICFFKDLGVLRTVSANGSAESIYDDIKKIALE